MENEKIFRTKTGYCHVLPDKVVLTRDGVIGNISKVTVGNNIFQILILYGLITAGLLYFTYDMYVKGQIFLPIIYLLISLYLIFNIITSLNNSATPVVERDKIKTVEFKKAIPGLTRSRFEVIFEDEYKKLKKRLIMLPGSMADGQKEAEKALKIMEEEKLITAR